MLSFFSYWHDMQNLDGSIYFDKSGAEEEPS
jgi:hypothetical protein